MTTALITMKPGDRVGEADYEMKLAGIRHIPVVDDRNHLVGIVSNRDILRALGRQRSGADGSQSVVIGEIMTKRLHRVSVSAPAREAAQLILEHKIGAIPVIGERGQLVGLVTETDFVRVAFEALGGSPTE